MKRGRVRVSDVDYRHGIITLADEDDATHFARGMSVTFAEAAPRWRPFLGGVVVGAALVFVAFLLTGCPLEVEGPPVCEPDSDELAEMDYMAVEAIAEARGRCLLVCWGDDERREVCP